MLILTARALTATAAIACTSLFAQSALADLPRHPEVASFGPANSDIGPEGEESAPEFGTAVAIREGLLFSGMPAYRGERGAVAVYAQTASGWRRTATLTARDTTAASSRFGRSITFRDGVLVVGANTAAYVFRRVNGVWKQLQKLTAPAADNAVTFADSLRYENGTLAV